MIATSDVYRKYLARTVRFACASLGDERSHAEDVAQEVWFRLLGREVPDDPKSLDRFLQVCVQRRAWAWAKRQRREREKTEVVAGAARQKRQRAKPPAQPVGACPRAYCKNPPAMARKHCERHLANAARHTAAHRRRA